MDTIIGEYYHENGLAKQSSGINYKFDTHDYLIYEVLRTTRGVLIFFEDHLERLNNSLKSLGIQKKCDAESLQNSLKELLTLNGNRTGNIKIVCKLTGEKLYFAAYYIPHEYPSVKMYQNGVKLITYEIERTDPDIKQVHVSEYVRNEIELARKRATAYEVLLMDNKGHITEGSRSNFFLIKNEKLFSPPDESLLPGITRKYVLQIARDFDIPIIKIPISYAEINSYESGFICGTSPKILPVNSIDTCRLQVENKITHSIQNKYDSIIQEYIDKK